MHSVNVERAGGAISPTLWDFGRDAVSLAGRIPGGRRVGLVGQGEEFGPASPADRRVGAADRESRPSDRRADDRQPYFKKVHGRLAMSDELRGEVCAALQEHPGARLTGVLRQLDVAASSWYHQPVSAELRKRPGSTPRPLAPEKTQAIERMATANPWYGYQRIAVTCRRAGQRERRAQCNCSI